MTFIKPYSETRRGMLGLDDEFARELEQAVSGIICGWTGGWFNLAVAYDNAGIQRKATAAYARGAKVRDIDAIIVYSELMWEAGRRAKAIQVRSLDPVRVPDEPPISPEKIREKDLVKSYWVEYTHHHVTEDTLADMTGLDPQLHAPDYAYWLAEHDRYEEAVLMLRKLISEKDCDLYLPLGVILSEHGNTVEAVDAYTSAIARGDYYSAFNLGLLSNQLGDRRKALSLIRLAASHDDRRAVRWLRTDCRRERRRKRGDRRPAGT